MAGTSPAMTLRVSPAMTLRVRCQTSHPLCPRLSRASTSSLRFNKQDVDGWDEPGHDASRQSDHDVARFAPDLSFVMPRLSRASTSLQRLNIQDVDGRNKSG